MLSLHRFHSHAGSTCRRHYVSLTLRKRQNVAAASRMTTQQPQQPQLIDPVPQGHTQRRRSFSSHQPKGPQPRRRFYKHVGVTEVSPPWELRLQAKRERAAGKAKSAKAIDNPISAGVDGTQSASGVIGHLGVVGVEDDLSDRVRMEELKERLIPRCTTITNLTGVMDHHAPDQWYTVTLDGKHLRTPVGQVLSVPSKLLAWAIAAEWDSQTTQIQPVQMPLMTLTCTALDQTAAHPEHYHKMALQYLPTDTTCYWADPTEDRALHRRQESAWKDLHGFIESKFDEKPAMAMGAQEGVLFSRRSKETGEIGLPHPRTLYEACVEWTRGLDAWHLTALNAVAAETKSFLVAYAVLHPDSPYSNPDSGTNADSLAKAIRAARVEEEFQIESWGLVEGQHDYDRLNCSVQLRSAKLLANFVLKN